MFFACRSMLHACTALIAPYQDARDAARSMVTENGGAFIEVYFETPIDVCEKRDRKGLYRKARQVSLISKSTGVGKLLERTNMPVFLSDTYRADKLLRCHALCSYSLTNFKGDLKNFTGIDDPYEAPSRPDIRINTSNTTVAQNVNTIVNYLYEQGYLKRPEGDTSGPQFHIAISTGAG